MANPAGPFRPVGFSPVMGHGRSHEMDHERFDAIARTLASGASRRGVLRTLSGVGAAGILMAIGRENAAAKSCKKFLRCGGKAHNKTCCRYQVTACDPQTDTCQSCTATFETCDPNTAF